MLISPLLDKKDCDACTVDDGTGEMSKTTTTEKPFSICLSIAPLPPSEIINSEILPQEASFTFPSLRSRIAIEDDKPLKMDGSDEVLSPSSSSPVKPLTAKTISLGNDENERSESYQNPLLQMDSKFHTLYQPAIKNFMASTVRASSKAVNPREKIVTEKKIEASGSTSTDAHQLKTPNLDPKVVSKQKGISASGKSSSPDPPLLSSSRVSKSVNGEENSFAPDSSLLPYERSFNYLSSRPKFLRYKPNRHREFFLGQKSEVGRGKDGPSPNENAYFIAEKGGDDEDSSISVGGSLDSTSQGRLLKQENGGSEKPEEKDDGVEEETICEEMEEERNGCLKWELKSSLLVFVILVLSTAYISSMNSPTPPPALQIIWGLREECLKIIEYGIFRGTKVKYSEGGREFFDEREEPQTALLEVKEQMVKHEAESVVEHNHELVEIVEVEYRENEEPQIGTFQVHGEMIKDEVEGIVENIHELFAVVEVENRGSEHDSGKAKIEEEINDDLSNNIELKGIQIPAKIESMEDDQIVMPFDLDGNQGKSYDNGWDTDSHFRDEELEDEVLITDQCFDEGDEEAKIFESSEKVEISGIDLEKMFEDPIGQMPSWLCPYSLAASAIFFVGFVASLVVRFCFKWKRASGRTNLMSKNLCSEAMDAEKSSLVLLTKKVKKEIEQIEKVDPSTEKKVPKETPRGSKALNVKLLGEFLFEEGSISLNSCAMGRKILETEESSHEKSMAARSCSSRLQASSPFEFSTINSSSPSNESFTSQQEKIAKKDGKSETTKVIQTPVRRSSRIRNRGMTSP
ncbi:hypothetical protein Nepgr_023994 [Nepenthes gracilis]|uniref:Uncharacterized protein n=1 Tax=Nepenthes gracilis TaxID=150966 RepID=A0AAD3T3X1_NEPGR|nr:hypothetical protein Nepgr_023994 [Nepenthes gracilis]